MIKLQNVCKSYYLGETEVKAVDNINLEIKAKEYIGILGSSGSGKSTLMYLIGLLEHPTCGSILFDGKDVSKLSDEALSKIRNQNVGFVFQSFNLISKYTVLENILLPTLYAKEKLEFDPDKRAEELLTKFGIYDRRHFYPNKISGGQQQRVAIARALMMNPKIILADEPTGNLDTKTGDEILDIMESLNKSFGVTVVLVTHEKDVANRTKRQIYIKDGVVVNRY
ncbi:MAG: ABC transporter related protein [Candidatus Woesebacteria bacterium GW2011_GWA1_39_21]|uniref:ABC transporter related protein n=1 Tax=Candidatus Woesebacteria bacterium GW2011_GWA1_39_21 TaxID=1618550 RepID=A0A0G0RCG4_9BACT|nr:MAG: ABC transporter related protein [Candidatus Woesebacteria bacterium GW2011_GWA1_39_21]